MWEFFVVHISHLVTRVVRRQQVKIFQHRTRGGNTPPHTPPMSEVGGWSGAGQPEIERTIFIFGYHFFVRWVRYLCPWGGGLSVDGLLGGGPGRMKRKKARKGHAAFF